MALHSTVYLRADSFADLAGAERTAVVFVPDQGMFCAFIFDNAAQNWRRVAGSVSTIDPGTEIDVSPGGTLVPSPSHVGQTSREQRLLDEVITTDAKVTALYTSDVIPKNSVIYVDSTILCKNATDVGTASLVTQSIFERHDNLLFSPQADRQTTMGSMGLAICKVASSIDAATSTFSINVIGKVGVVLKWYSNIHIRRNVINPVSRRSM